MSQTNVDLVGSMLDLFNRRRIDRVLADVQPDFEMDWSNSIGPHRGVYRSREELLKFWSSFFDAFESVHWEPQEFIDVDDARVIVVNRVQIRGLGSGIEVDATGAQVWTITNGRAQSVKLYQTKAEALEAVGLRE
jgi:ketosteroid isomerase-like protein